MDILSSSSCSLDSPLPLQSSRCSINESVIAQIEAIVEGIFDGFFDAKHTHTIRLKVKTPTNGFRAPHHLDGNIPYTIRHVKYPGSTAQEAWRFTVITRILGLIHEALVNNVTISKRSIYYKDTKLFKAQKTVDRYVDILAFTLGVQRADLNVVAVARGLIIGALKLLLKDGGTVFGGIESKVSHPTKVNESSRSIAQPLLIPDASTITSTSAPSACWILVIEKDSALQALATTNFHCTCAAGPGIMITGKGYPDISTRALLHKLSLNPFCPPSFALIDFDPDGIAIMSTYKHGSFTLSHENKSLIVPNIRWLGPKSRDICGDNENEGKGLLMLTRRDRRKAVGLLERVMDREEEWKRELQVMLMIGFKAEIEILSERLGGLEGWAERKLSEELSCETNAVSVRRGGGACDERMVDEEVLEEYSRENPLIDGMNDETLASNTLREETVEEWINEEGLEEMLITKTHLKKSENEKLIAKRSTEDWINEDGFGKKPSLDIRAEDLKQEQPGMSTSTNGWISEKEVSQLSTARTLVGDPVGEGSSGRSASNYWIDEEEFDDMLAEGTLGQQLADGKEIYNDGRNDEDMFEEILLEGNGMHFDEDDEDLLAMLG